MHDKVQEVAHRIQSYTLNENENTAEMKIWNENTTVADIVTLGGISIKLSFNEFMEQIQYSNKTRMRAEALPVISTMFHHWPFISACTTGIGATLMLGGLSCIIVASIGIDYKFNLRDWLLVLCPLKTCMMWLSIASSSDEYLSKQDYGWTHVTTTAIFIAVALITFVVIYLILKHFMKFLMEIKDTLNFNISGSESELGIHDDIQHYKNFIEHISSIVAPIECIKYIILLAGICAMVVLGASVAQKQRPDDIKLNTLLLVAEFLTLEMFGLASALVVYCYSQVNFYLMQIQ
jgi:hypothetical protein